MIIPIVARMALNNSMAVNDCLNTRRALTKSPAPIRWATWTENPVDAALITPQNSQVVVDTNPIEADALAPRLPTMDASIYCMAMDDNCAIIAGKLNNAVSLSCCLRLMLLPSRIIASKASVLLCPWSINSYVRR